MATVQLNYTKDEINNGLLKGLNMATIVSSTNGDYSTLLEAINGGATKIYIKNGTYNEISNIDITTNDTIIYGESEDGVKLVFPNGNDGIRIFANSCIVSNVTIDTQTNNGNSALIIGDGQSVGSQDTSIGNDNRVNKCIIKGSGSTYALKVQGASYTASTPLTAFELGDLQYNNRITNCNLYSTWSGDAFYFGLQKNGTFSNNYCDGGRLSIYMCKQSEFSSNSIIDSASHGILISSPTKDNVITSNKIYNSTDSSIKLINQTDVTPLLAGQGAINNTICNNTILTSNNNGIEISGDTSFEANGNIISNNSLDACGNNGIYINNAINNTINANSIKDARYDGGVHSTGSGIYLYQNVINNNITNNTILDDRSNILYSGIFDYDTSNIGNNITGNKINANNSQYTIWIKSDKTNINGNYITGGNLGGIYINGASNCNVNGNTCKNNTSGADNTYYEILVNSNGSGNNINSNIIISDDTNKAIQDINLSTGSENCRAIGNMSTGTYSKFIEQVNYDPTGWIVDSNGELDLTTAEFDWDDATRTFTISPTGTNFNYMWRGIKYTKSSQESIQISDNDGIHWIYYVGDTLSETYTFDFNLILGDTLVAALYWNSTSGEAINFLEERHGCDMQNATHYHLHTSIGTYYNSGLELTDFNLGSGTLASDVQFNMGSGSIYDEDIPINIVEATPTQGCPVFYRSGASGLWYKSYNVGYSALTTGTGRLAYNEWTGATWQLTEVSNNDFVCYHIYATNDMNYQWFSIMGQDSYLNASAARTGANTEINDLQFGQFPSTEFIAVGTIIYQTSDGYSNAIKAKIVQNDLSTDYLDWRKRKINRHLLLDYS